MGTSVANLSTAEYVKINSGRKSITLQSIRDEVRIVLSSVKPALGNVVFHTLNGGDDPLQFSNIDTDVWALAITDTSKLVITETRLTSTADETTDTKTYNTDAWYREKVVNDKSLFHGMFTYNIPADTWYEMIDDVEQTAFVSATSADGKLNLVSGALNEKRQLRSFRHPRYEPNRGHIYSISAFLPSPSASGERTFGLFTKEAGAAFRLRDGTLYAVRRTTIGGTTTDTEVEITLPAGIDLAMGNVFDIQFQWRGVGSFFFYINLQKVASLDLLGTLDELSVFNPALPVAYECINQGDAVTIQGGCVDVSSEGGKENGKTYGSVGTSTEAGSIAYECINQGDAVTIQGGCVDVSSEGGKENGKTYGSVGTSTEAGSIAVSGFNQPVLVVRNKKLFGSLLNTRDMVALLATVYADQRCVFRVWTTRDETTITLNDQTWQDFRDGHIDYIEYDNPNVANPITFDTTKAVLVFGSRVDQDQSYSTSALFEGRTDINQTPGDIFIFTVHRETGGATNVGCNYEFAEAI